MYVQCICRNEYVIFIHNIIYVFISYIYIFFFAFVMNFPPPTYQSSALHQAALDAMDVGPTLLQSNKARNSQYQNPHWDRTEMGKEGYSGRISAFFLLFFRESHLMMMPWRRMAGICMPQIDKRLKFKTASIWEFRTDRTWIICGPDIWLTFKNNCQ